MLKRDEMYYAREDVAFNAWLTARKERLRRFMFGLDPEGVRDLVRSAFISGARFASEEAEIQAAVAALKAGKGQ